ncbi:CopL family metal-binding regulatory protein [Vulcaniibacterium gelatinicum]|uniref:CopL family metal-binding regulatory protein n=1 Tax=Vulcaniibacterium gelatinicum TaxID=2598725 RepID=UPI0011CB9FD0
MLVAPRRRRSLMLRLSTVLPLLLSVLLAVSAPYAGGMGGCAHEAGAAATPPHDEGHECPDHGAAPASDHTADTAQAEGSCCDAGACRCGCLPRTAALPASTPVLPAPIAVRVSAPAQHPHADPPPAHRLRPPIA